MPEWTVVGKQMKVISSMLGAGFDNQYTYILEDEEGNTKTVSAGDKYELGEKISEGDFDEDD